MPPLMMCTPVNVSTLKPAPPTPGTIASLLPWQNPLLLSVCPSGLCSHEASIGASCSVMEEPTLCLFSPALMDTNGHCLQGDTRVSITATQQGHGDSLTPPPGALQGS